MKVYKNGCKYWTVNAIILQKPFELKLKIWTLITSWLFHYKSIMVMCRGKITTIISIISRGNTTLEWGTNMFWIASFHKFCLQISQLGVTPLNMCRFMARLYIFSISFKTKTRTNELNVKCQINKDCKPTHYTSSFLFKAYSDVGPCNICTQVSAISIFFNCKKAENI